MAPTATTSAASAVTSTGATLNGSVNNRGATTTVTFEYGTTTNYGTNVAATPSTVAGGARNVAVAATLAGLAPSTTYQFRVRGTNSAGTTLGANQSFTTPAAAPVAPTATTSAASAVTATGATLNGRVSGMGATTTVSFEYGTTTSYGTSVAATPSTVAAGAGNVAVAATLAGLAPGTTYQFRVRGTNSAGTTLGANQSFTTPAAAPVAPTAATSAASAITSTGATLNGNVNDRGAATTVTFEYGTTTSYGTSVAATPSTVAAGAGNVAVAATLAGLAPSTTYQFRVRGTNSAGTTLGTNQSFTTPAAAPVAPTATTSAASAITSTGATLNGNVNDRGAATTVTFEYGTTTSYGTSIAATPATVAAGAGNVAVAATLAGLAPSTTYQFRVRGTNSAGTTLGANQSFTTPATETLSCGMATVLCVGGPQSEFATIQAAITAANPAAGKTVLVFDGNYAGFQVPSNRSGTLQAPFTVKAQAGNANITSTASGSDGDGIWISNADYVVVEGFRIDNMSGHGIGCHNASSTNPMVGVTIRNNTVTNSGISNIYCSNAAGSLIENNVATGAKAEHGIYLANGGADNTTIRGNVLSGNFRNGLHLNGDISIGGDGLHTGIVIEGNTIFGNTDNAMDLDGMYDSTIRNNLIYGNGHHGIRVFQIDASAGAGNLRIFNNTIVIPTPATGVRRSSSPRTWGGTRSSTTS
ncbi:MAG: right-handed parallel beta-helix repeat-containing protein [Betaproteobacteria bacterium]|nr:right-handed parallel beta-helix repeat-containing protein [Betaproteobacteria bacterium]